MNSFTFYTNYYELIKYLNDEQRLLMYDAILKYMFEDKEPKLDGLLNGIWINLKFPLDTSKKCSLKGKKGGAPSGNDNAKKQPKNNLKTNQKQPKNNLKTNQKQANNISTFLFLISNMKEELLRERTKEWLEYKIERKEEYKESGFKKLISQIENNSNIYGEQAVCELIDTCMANNWAGIIFEKLKNKPKAKVVPNWINKEIENSGELEDKEFNQFIEEFRNEKYN